MTTYLGEKAVGIGTVKATKAVAGDVLHDETLVGNGNTEPLGVDKQVIATTNQVGNLATTLHAAIEAQAEAIAKTRNDFEVADQEIRADMNEKDAELEHMITEHAEELTTLRGNQASLGDQVSNIESKIPESASETNPLITKQQLLDEEMDIRDDYNGMISELQTQITAQAGEIAKLDSEKIDKNQGTINAGKYLMVGDDGIVGLTESGGGGGIANVIHDSTLTGKGTKDDPLGVNTEVIATKEDLESKQDKLTAGANIKIEDNVISSTAQESFFRGRWETWEDVPSNANSYPEDFNGNRTPTTNDYMVVVDASQYVPGMNDSIIISKPQYTHYFIINGVNVGNPYQARTYTYDSVTYTVENTGGGNLIKLYADKTVQYKGQIIPAGATIISTTYSRDAIEPANLYYSKLDNLSGTWRFGYKGVWAVDNESGWKPEYQIEETLPIASETQAGIAKLYTTSGTNTDGAMTQKAITENTTRVIIRRWN